ncbi:uncharacterized protein LOC126316945 [Schistocerca gregaria]|uniref:uncharacterized protein LOC126316945 n=1 Tax=Schistocerca gregaria TaxID=7010 RepID=UPI00211DC303|nr:uncharacterized protein LOC126316945 [Schistocerca gregaria]XP_049848935.1 uncharacterized protein LOC126316945 [Schistocerca gregaria]XP_049848936.1 uncharacterized protein LOC126316945 [Schistocerca gregaria]XP_049848937.1 uncharacterized protein LOC126316945 [Schistocerca gregaria]
MHLGSVPSLRDCAYHFSLPKHALVSSRRGSVKHFHIPTFKSREFTYRRQAKMKPIVYSNLRFDKYPFLQHIGHNHDIIDSSDGDKGSNVSDDREHKRIQTIGIRLTVLGLVTNVILTVSKGLFGIIGNSASLVSDSLHSLGDLITDSIALATYHIASKPTSSVYPYGYYKFDSLGGFTVSFLLVVTGLGIGWQAAVELASAPAVTPTPITLWIALGCIITKELLFQMTIRIAKKANSTVLVANAWHHRIDAISTALAFVGIGGEMLGIPYLDNVAAIFVAGIVVKSGVSVIRRAIDELTDRNYFDKFEKHFSEVSELLRIRIGRVRLRKSGQKLIADLVIIADSQDLHQTLELARSAKKKLREKIPALEDIVIEIHEKENRL